MSTTTPHTTPGGSAGTGADRQGGDHRGRSVRRRRRGQRARRVAIGGLLALVPTAAVTVAQGPATVAAATCGSYEWTDAIPLDVCSRGLLVTDLQQRLNQVNPHTIATDGFFGPVTELAVREFQRRHGLAVDGIVGPRTWARLNELTSAPRPGSGCARYEPVTDLPMQLCDEGLLVARLQQLLNRFLPGPDLAVDGRFGPQTAGRVREFQSAAEIGQDGIVGPVTWWVLHVAAATAG
ncbi:MAG: peptidoglycan-binding domain-containing protein [Desertimonas sp.]